MVKVEFKPLSILLIQLEKTNCLFCNEPAIHAANSHYGNVYSEVRCCGKERCMKLAEQLATIPED